MPSKETRAILITGCSSGIGYACAHGLRERGYRVFASARKPEDVERLSSDRPGGVASGPGRFSYDPGRR